MNEKQLKALEKRIKVIEDIEAIKDLKTRLFKSMNYFRILTGLRLKEQVELETNFIPLVFCVRCLMRVG